MTGGGSTGKVLEKCLAAALSSLQVSGSPLHSRAVTRVLGEHALMGEPVASDLVPELLHLVVGADRGDANDDDGDRDKRDPHGHGQFPAGLAREPNQEYEVHVGTSSEHSPDLVALVQLPLTHIVAMISQLSDQVVGQLQLQLEQELCAGDDLPRFVGCVPGAPRPYTVEAPPGILD